MIAEYMSIDWKIIQLSELEVKDEIRTLSESGAIVLQERRVIQQATPYRDRAGGLNVAVRHPVGGLRIYHCV